MKRTVSILIFGFCSLNLTAQSGIFFQHLNTNNGLSYTGANDMCVDKKGNLWVGTGNGLNMFNGRTVEKYFATDYPQLANSAIVHVVCDEKDRIWLLTYGGGVTMIDEKRQFHRIALYEGKDWVKTLWILYNDKYGAVLYTAKGNYSLKENSAFGKTDSITTGHFNFLPIKGKEKYQLTGAGRSFHFDDNHYLITYPNVVLLVRYDTNTVEKMYSIPNCNALLQWKPNELLFYDGGNKEIKSVDLVTEEIKRPFKDMKDQKGRPVNAQFGYALKINDNRYILTSTDAGIFVYYKNAHRIYNYRHEVTDPASLGSNNATTLTLGPKGWVFVTCYINGVSYFNIHDVIGNQNVFVDSHGNGYDGTIAGIATRDNDTYYIGTNSGLVEWKRSTNTSTFIDFTGNDGKPIFKDREISSIVTDDYGNIWATVFNSGVVVIDKNRKLIKHLRREEGNKHSLKQVSFRRIKKGPDGYMWICGRNGICRINPKTFEVDNLENTALQQLDSIPISPLLFDENYMWIAASDKGLFRYDFTSNQLTEYAGYSKYKTEGIYDINIDSAGTLYVANGLGLRIFYKDGREKRFTQKDGLLINRAEGLLLDKDNRMWVGNDIGLACFDPADSSLRVFDGRQGLSIYGFRVGSYFKMPDGEFMFGTPRGVQYFHPDSLYDKKTSLNVLISKIETKNIFSNITGNDEFKLTALDNQVTFHFSTVDFSPHIRTYYEYKLVDLDKEWIKTADLNSVRYNSLPPGKYVFKVRISNDNINWQDADNEVTVSIAAPFYQTLWFKTIGVLIGLFLIWYVIKYYKRNELRHREELETQVVINYFASQINRHRKTEDILWDVAKNCISKLNFEDCVIYLLDEERNVLLQKAAWGPKMAKDFTIHQPIEIPVGNGIVGSVAQSGKPEVIGNTELDKRYIADDVRRFSELAVPLIIDNKVIGVIDSEHSRKNFFTKRHLTILSTVAVLCGTQIKRAKAEQEELEAQLVINYFASQIHSRYKTDELLWDVAKNLIGKMGFEDCMIYLWNDDKTLLVQKAGYGSKGSMQAIMDKTAYHIPRGKGIVGAAVESRQNLLVNDTSRDERYFTADGKIMLSELCVPLIHDNEVLGAINTEHHLRNFFTIKQLKMLSAIAVLCANQIQRIRAEEEKQQARIEALQNKQKAAETRLQSLRLQMNPHFLFNALNSIQQMILANEEMVATKYLSKFSKLLRTILVHSDKEFVTLKEELEILNLYIELESIRFKSSFHYHIDCDENVDAEEIMVPTLLIQPFVENAIWHGLMHKEGNRFLQVKFFETNDLLHCIVEDNGIGREKSREAKLATGQGSKHTSKGIQVSQERLKTMGNGNGRQGSLQIYDLKDEKGNAAGTRVEIIFPTQNN